MLFVLDTTITKGTHCDKLYFVQYMLPVGLLYHVQYNCLFLCNSTTWSCKQSWKLFSTISGNCSFCLSYFIGLPFFLIHCSLFIKKHLPPSHIVLCLTLHVCASVYFCLLLFLSACVMCFLESNILSQQEASFAWFTGSCSVEVTRAEQTDPAGWTRREG